MLVVLQSRGTVSLEPVVDPSYVEAGVGWCFMVGWLTQGPRIIYWEAIALVGIGHRPPADSEGIPDMALKSPAEVMTAEIDETFGLSSKPGKSDTFPQRLGLITRPVIHPYGDDHVSVYFAFRTLSGDFVGERSDIHDLITIGISAGARGEGICCEMVDVANPAIPELGEIYGRFLVPAQPLGPLYSTSDQGQLESMLLAIWRAETSVWEAIGWPGPEGSQAFDGFGSSDWIERVRAAVRQTGDALTYDRRSPTWNYFHSPRTGLTIARSRSLARLVRRAASSLDDAARLPHLEGLFVREGLLRNFAPQSKVERAQRILRQAEAQLQLQHLEPAILALEDRVLAANETHLVSIPAECGRDSFVRARSRLLERHREEVQILYGPQSFSWADQVPAERFKGLIRELLAASGKVARVRSAGPTRDRDRGRDLLADWLVTEASRSVPKGRAPAKTIRTVVQCKVRSRTVGKSDVRDVRDTLERHNADGFFVAVSSELSGDLVIYLDDLQERTSTMVDWWTRAEIEDELRRNVEIAERYRDVVSVCLT